MRRARARETNLRAALSRGVAAVRANVPGGEFTGQSAGRGGIVGRGGGIASARCRSGCAERKHDLDAAPEAVFRRAPALATPETLFRRARL